MWTPSETRGIKYIILDMFGTVFQRRKVMVDSLVRDLQLRLGYDSRFPRSQKLRRFYSYCLHLKDKIAFSCEATRVSFIYYNARAKKLLKFSGYRLSANYLARDEANTLLTALPRWPGEFMPSKS